MKNRYLILGFVLLASTVMSCVKDLDVKPNDPSTTLSDNVKDSPELQKQFLAKIYASFIISGQGANNGGDDITATDGNFFTTMRALWNCQEITTDEAICAWGDVGIADLNTQTWNANNPFLTALYQRLGLSITYANEFIRLTNGSTSPTTIRYNAEARYLRALAYYWYMDMFGNPPFTTEADAAGKFNPRQITRANLFNYITTELRAIEPNLAAPRTSSSQANKAAAWMLLARTYLNSKVYTNVAKMDSCKIYCDKVISSGYSLATNYRQNFSADNDGTTNQEMIFALSQDGVNTQGAVGTTFIIESSSDATYIRAEDFHGLTNNTNWNGNRARKQFMNILVDPATTYGGPVPSTDVLFSQCADKRVFLKMKKSMDIPTASSSGDYGIGVYKFTAKNSNPAIPVVNYNAEFACTDFPVFRLADAYLMRAEAKFTLGDMDGALTDINVVRERAFGNTSRNFITLTAQDILDERAREFYYEGQRRTDLVRFGKFTDGGYNWDWKGGVATGVNTDKHLNIFPIPGEEVSANPNMKQNQGY